MDQKADTTNAQPDAARQQALFRLARKIRRRLRGRDGHADDVAIIQAAGAFDAQYYLARYPDVKASGKDPLLHYLENGAAERRNPSASFNTGYYLDRYPDVVASGMNPLRHYIQYGAAESRRTQKPAKPSVGKPKAKAKPRTDREIIAASGLFDPAWYLDAYPGVARAGMAPIAHYLKYGAGEGKNPSQWFDTRYYLDTYPDVAAAGANPLVHFCRYGRQELRNPSPDFDMAWYWLARLAADNPAADPLADYRARGADAADDVRPVGPLSGEERERVRAAAADMLATEHQDAAIAIRLGMALARLAVWPDAEKAYSAALSLRWDDARLHARMAEVLTRQGKWWQAADAWDNAVQRSPGNAPWLYHLGEAQEKMNRFEQAAQAYQQAIDLEPEHPQWYYLLGYMHEKAGHSDLADAAYTQALARDARDDVQNYGIGVFHQARGYWPEAAEAYARRLEAEPFSAGLHYKLGMAHDRCYRWDDALAAYHAAIRLEPSQHPYWHYRYGFVLERLERWVDAAQAYAAAAMLSKKPMPYWRYRQGYVLAKAGEREQACLAYIATRQDQTLSGDVCRPEQADAPTTENGQEVPEITSAMDASSKKALPAAMRKDASLADYLVGFDSESAIEEMLRIDYTCAATHYRLGECRERKQDWEGAAGAYADAVARSNSHQPKWYYRLGFVLYRAGRRGEACDAFRETRILRRAHGVDWSKYQYSPEQKMLMEYNEYLETLPIRERCIVFESMHGASVGGNPKAILEHLFADTRYVGWIYVWVLRAGADAPAQILARQDVVLATRGSDLYRRYLATSSHLINDVTFPYWFIRRPKQKYLNTWHGTPIKKLGKHIPGEFMAHCNIQRNLLHATHLISPNPHTSETLLESYDIKGIFSGKLAETGYPRVDREILATQDNCTRIRAELGLTREKPVVLYAPTWRGEHSDAQLDVERLREDIVILASLPCQVVFRGHHMVEALLDKLELPAVVAGQQFDTSDVLAITDVLITDYSSILFDFLPLKRPIICYAHDEEEYARKRGLYFEIERLPGDYCKTRESLKAAVAQQLELPDTGSAAYEDATARFCPYEDGHASARAVSFFLEDDNSHVVQRFHDDRLSLLMFNGLFPPNGITASFLNLNAALAQDRRYQITIPIDPARIAAEPAWMDKLRELPASVSVVGRIGRMVQSPEDYWIAEKFGHRRKLPTEPMWNILKVSYEREFTRTFGKARLATIINFEGYSAFWTALLGFGPRKMRNVSYLHNDMIEEYRLKHPYLRSVFASYPYYRKLVSVSAHMSAVNKKKLGKELSLPGTVFTSCINYLNVEQIRKRAQEPLDDDVAPWFEGTTTFLNMGRLSPEKDHAKLITAFGEVHAKRPETRLIIMGDGPLRGVLALLVRQLGLEHSVLLAGLRKNPFPALTKCDCFVLSSNHEGQPMVLLEAMLLKKPIIATDIPGSRGVLGEAYGVLTDNTVSGLSQCMQRFLEGGQARNEFDIVGYQTKAIDAFRAMIGDAVVEAQQAHELEEHPSNRIVVAARADGLGERMNALLNGMYLAEKLGFRFAYHWSASGTWVGTGVDAGHHAIVPEEEFFSPKFVARYGLGKFHRKGFREVAGKDLTRTDLLGATRDDSFRGWLAPRVNLNEVLCDELLPGTDLSFHTIFKKIGFSDTIMTAIQAAESVDLPARCVALHLRSGDIFYGPYRKWVHYSYKGITLPIAKAIIDSVKQERNTVLLFGQDKEVMEYLSRETGAVRLCDFDNGQVRSSAAQAMYELVLMARCRSIVAGSSGFARQASLLGGIAVRQPKDFFGHAEQTKIALADLARYGDDYHPLQTSFAYWYAYYFGRQFKSYDEAMAILKCAYKYDPDNQLYPLKLAFICFRWNRLQEGDAWLKYLLNAEFTKLGHCDLESFKVLTAKTLGRFNLAEDFDVLSDAANKGMPYAAACNYRVQYAIGGSHPDALKQFSRAAGDDPLLARLHEDWMH